MNEDWTASKKPKNVNKNTALEIALNTFFFIIGEDI